MENKQSNIEVFEFSKYVLPSIEPTVSRKWVLNGDNNSFYKYVQECYDGSTTNASIINAFSNYIYGDGLKSKGGQNILQYISKKDTRLIALDYKTYGAYALQVIWNLAKTKPIQLKYIPVFKLGLNVDKDTMKTNGYWYSFDWENSGKYKPVFFHMYDGRYKDNDVEILMVQRPSSKPFFANPDYLPALQYAQAEMEIANYTINHILNGFQAGTLINYNNGTPTDEVRELNARTMKNKLTGTSHANRIVSAYNESAAQAMTIESIAPPELGNHYEIFSQKCQDKLIEAHSVSPILFSASRDGGGLGNNAQEMSQAITSLYRKSINPYREAIIDGLNEVFTKIDSSIDLYFQDFESFNNDNTANTPQA
jgi:hypothetical protein